MTRIYADYAATTPLCAEAKLAMTPWLDTEFGNASSLHEQGRRARAAIDEVRETIADRLGCLFAETIFTSSGTEAANLAIVGSALAANVRARILMAAAEHHCVLNTRANLERLGYRVELVPVDRSGLVDLDALGRMLGDDVLLVSVMHANNEVGTISPAAEVAQRAHQFGALVHCDAVQTFTVWDWTVGDLEADLVSISAHKLGGPKGAGALYVRAGTKLQPLIVGGGQERELRAGTENVAAIVGFAAAVRATSPSPCQYAAATAFSEGLENSAVRTLDVGVPALPGIVHVRFTGVSAESLLIRLDRMGVSASAGAACSSGSLEPSHVMLACGYTEAEAKEGVRFSFGRAQQAEEGTRAAQIVRDAVKAIRGA